MIDIDSEKKYLTEDDKEELCKDIYEIIQKLREENKAGRYLFTKVDKKINDLKELYIELENEHKSVVLLAIGKGKYYDQSIESTLIQSRINNIKEEQYDYYKKSNNDKSRQSEYLLLSLEEDLENAKIAEKELDTHVAEVEKKYIECKEELKTFKKLQGKIIKIVENNSNCIYFLETVARDVNQAFEDNRQVNTEKLKRKIKCKIDCNYLT